MQCSELLYLVLLNCLSLTSGQRICTLESLISGGILTLDIRGSVIYRHRELLYMQKEVRSNNFEFVDAPYWNENITGKI
jgi:hypothetical protein